MKEETQDVQSLKYRSVILIFLIVVSVGILILLQTRDASFDSSREPLAEKGVPAPNFTLPDLEGKMVSLTDYRGKVILLNIWATWCPPCVDEMPSMEKLHQELKNENLSDDAGPP